jgi:hypothetical protein
LKEGAKILLCYDNNGQLIVKDEYKFSSWVKPPRVRHMNKLDYNNEYVQQAINRFSSAEPMKIYNHIRMFYWLDCNDIDEFSEKIKHKLEEIKNINELIL